MSGSGSESSVGRTWFGLTGYQWFVFIVCCLAWDMDCMDQQLFVVGRRPAMQELVAKDLEKRPLEESDVVAMMKQSEAAGRALTEAAARAKLVDNRVTDNATRATSFFMIGWAIGGIAFGLMGDRFGRVRTLMLTIFMYSLFTGLSALSRSTTEFHLYRLVTGLGVGGVFAAAVSLLAETLPVRSRPLMLGLFQASSVLGNCTAALLSMYLGWLTFHNQLPFTDWAPWRLMFLVGILPGFLVVLVQFGLKEPEQWKAASKGRKAGSYRELLGTPRWKRNALGGLLLAIAGVVGLWGISFFIVDLQAAVAEPKYQQAASEMVASEGLVGEEAAKAQTKYVAYQKSYWAGVTSLFQNGGSFFGIFSFSLITMWLGRRWTFGVFFVFAAMVTGYVFLNLNDWNDIFWMVPLMGFFQLSVFGGYAIYLPELFPTRLRSTGTSFCYNVGRLVSAAGPWMLGYLKSGVFGSFEGQDPLRYAGLTMCLVYSIGLIALLFLPETKGKPLPEDD